MSHLHIDQESLKQVALDNPDAPVYILNLLKFREKAAEGFGVDGLSGEEAFHVYSKKFYVLNEQLGGEAIWMGPAGVTFVGSEQWHLIVLARYPDRQKLVDFMAGESYAEIADIRAAALEDSRMIAADQIPNGDDVLGGRS